LVNADVFVEELGKQHLDNLVDDGMVNAELASGLLHDTFVAEVDDVVQNLDDNEVTAMADVLSGALILMGRFDLLWHCAVCNNQAAQEATFCVSVEQRHLPPIACLL
jgi:hypothetical protein